MTSIADRLKEQEDAMNQSGQSSQAPKEYLASINPQLAASSSYTSSRPASRAANNALVVAAKADSPSNSRGVYKVAEVPPTALVECPSPTAVKNGDLQVVDTHPATGYPPTDASYMNNLPQDLYSPKVFLPRHVTEALELCVAVLERHTSTKGLLSGRDEQLIDQIASYKGRNVTSIRRLQIAPNTPSPTKGLRDIQNADGSDPVAL